MQLVQAHVRHSITTYEGRIQLIVDNCEARMKVMEGKMEEFKQKMYEFVEMLQTHESILRPPEETELQE